jgi:hypothetical protein
MNPLRPRGFGAVADQNALVMSREGNIIPAAPLVLFDHSDRVILSDARMKLKFVMPKRITRS